MTIILRYGLAVGVIASLVVADSALGRGFGGARGGGARGGGFSGGGFSRGGAVQTPSFSGGRQGGVRTGATPGGGSITIGGTRGAAGGPGGSAAGRAGGVQVTTPGGRTLTKGGASGAVRTPGGTAGVQIRGGSASGPRGSVGGVQGRGIATDGGFGRYSGGVRVGGGGSVGGHRTRAVAVSTRHGHAVGVRRGFYQVHPGYHGWFGAGWHVGHPGAWRARRLAGAAIWIGITWAALADAWEWDSGSSYYYDYGNTVVYEGDQVYYDDKAVASAEEYYDQASGIAERGLQEVDDEAEWMSLGVWAMVQGDETRSNKILQIAVNKEGVIRGNYYDALTETALPIQGSVDKRTQRAAWTVGNNSEAVYETGIYNMTNEETEMLIHFGKDKTQQWSLVRLEAPKADAE